MDPGRKQMKQMGDVVNIPEQYRGVFDDYDDLVLTESEKAVFEELYKRTHADGSEYGAVIVNVEASELFSSGEANRVYIDENMLHTSGTKIYHSHTNETPPSIQDLKYLTHPNVDEIGVISSNGDVYIVSVGFGEKINTRVFNQDAKKVYNDVNIEMVSNPDFFEWSIGERNYRAIREQFYRISRLYGWTMKGGRL